MKGDLTYALFGAFEAIADWCDLPTNYSKVALPIDVAAARVAARMPRIYLYEDGRGSLDAVSDAGKDAPDLSQWCFGFDGGCFLKLEHLVGSVTNVWFEASISNVDHLTALRKALAEIDVLAPSILSDARLEMAGVVAQESFFANYFRCLSGR